MFYVYNLRSINSPKQTYIGVTSDLKKRFETHNSGGSRHTAKFRPWIIDFYIAFKEKDKACQFEKYLKSGSGRAFTKRHFL